LNMEPEHHRGLVQMELMELLLQVHHTLHLGC
jgi:hypothetical protein